MSRGHCHDKSIASAAGSRDTASSIQLWGPGKEGAVRQYGKART